MSHIGPSAPRVSAFWIAVAGLALLAVNAQAGEVRGRLRLEVPGLALAEAGPVLVYLEAADGAAHATAARATAEIRQHKAQFTPSFLVVARGQEVTMPNDDGIYHNVFSYSAPNDFDLGLYPAGQSRSVRFEHTGPVRVYCSIHESMNATLFVAPTPWFSELAADGRFVLSGVPDGRWHLDTWAERLPPTRRTVTLAGDPVEVEVVIGANGAQAAGLQAAPTRR